MTSCGEPRNVKSPRDRLLSLYRGAGFLAALAHHESDEQFSAFAGAIICKLFDGADGTEDLAWETVRCACMMQDRKRVERTIVRGVRIINEERLEAAFAAVPKWLDFLRRANEYEPTEPVPTHASKKMLDAVSAHIVSKRADPRLWTVAESVESMERLASDSPRGRHRPSGAQEIDSANILSRNWKRSLPVLHMCIALSASIEGNDLILNDILYDSDRLDQIINHADVIRATVARVFNIKRQYPPLLNSGAIEEMPG
jgi:hypothetical protein